MTTNTTTLTPTTFAIGDEVIINPIVARSGDHGVVYIITKVPNGPRQVNYTAARKDAPHLPGIRGRADVFMTAPEDGPRPATAVAVPYVPTPESGTLLRVKGHPSFQEGSLWVSLGRTSKGMKIAKFGGDAGRYYTGVSAAYFEIVPIESVIVG